MIRAHGAKPTRTDARECLQFQPQRESVRYHTGDKSRAGELVGHACNRRSADALEAGPGVFAGPSWGVPLTGNSNHGVPLAPGAS